MITGIVGLGLCGLAVFFFASDTEQGPTAAWICLAIGVFMLLVAALGRLGRKGRERMLAEGAPGICEIVAIRDTGVYVNEQPRLELSVRLHREGHAPRDLDIKRVIGPDMAGRIEPGARLPIRFGATSSDKDWIFDPNAPAQRAAPAATAGAGVDGDTVAGELERLTALHQQGALSDEEFAAAKRRLLS